MGRSRISFNTIVPKKGFLFDLFEAEIRKAMETRAKPQLRALFYGTTQGWETPVYFRGTIRTIQGKSIKLTVQPYGDGKELYDLVSRGAPRHPIPKSPKTDGYLRFLAGYSPATSPGSLTSKRKQRFGDVVYTKWVPDHPGFEPRNFDIEIAKQYAPQFIKEMEAAVNIFTRKQELEFKRGQKSPNPTPVQRN